MFEHKSWHLVYDIIFNISVSLHNFGRVFINIVNYMHYFASKSPLENVRRGNS